MFSLHLSHGLMEGQSNHEKGKREREKCVNGQMLMIEGGRRGREVRSRSARWLDLTTANICRYSHGRGTNVLMQIYPTWNCKERYEKIASQHNEHLALQHVGLLKRHTQAHSFFQSLSSFTDSLSHTDGLMSFSLISSFTNMKPSHDFMQVIRENIVEQKLLKRNKTSN